MSMSNEAFFSAPSAMTGVSRLLTRMVERCHQLDPTRLQPSEVLNVLWVIIEST